MTKTHPADTADLALILACKKFTATILKDNKQQTTEFGTLAGAMVEAAKLNATTNNGRRALVYAITAGDRAILVPGSYGKEVPAAQIVAAIKAAKLTGAKKAVAKPAKPAPAKKAAKSAAKKAVGAPAKRDGSKVATVIAMLTGKKAITRKDIVEATGWQVDLKQLCARKGMKLKKTSDGFVSATPPKV